MYMQQGLEKKTLGMGNLFERQCLTTKKYMEDSIKMVVMEIGYEMG